MTLNNVCFSRIKALLKIFTTTILRYKNSRSLISISLIPLLIHFVDYEAIKFLILMILIFFFDLFIIFFAYYILVILVVLYIYRWNYFGVIIIIIIPTPTSINHPYHHPIRSVVIYNLNCVSFVFLLLLFFYFFFSLVLGSLDGLLDSSITTSSFSSFSYFFSVLLYEFNSIFYNMEYGIILLRTLLWLLYYYFILLMIFFLYRKKEKQQHACTPPHIRIIHNTVTSALILS